MVDGQWLQALMGRCQVLAGRFPDVPASAVILEMQSLVAGLPPDQTKAEQFIASGVLSRSLSRIVHAAGLGDRIEIAHAFQRLAASEDWCAEWLRVTASCAALPNTPMFPRRVIDPRVLRMLELLDTRFTDPTLDVSALAEAVNLSPSHAIRILKQHSGDGFVAHLSHRRVSAARRLLATTTLSIKEVAAAAGYNHASEFSRQFKLSCRMTPATFRANHRARSSSM
jgi:AraC-like DNA-binding protein